MSYDLKKIMKSFRFLFAGLEKKIHNIRKRNFLNLKVWEQIFGIVVKAFLVYSHPVLECLDLSLGYVSDSSFLLNVYPGRYQAMTERAGFLPCRRKPWLSSQLVGSASPISLSCY